MEPKTFFVFDVESVGLHGESFAVAGGILHYPLGIYDETFCFACSPDAAKGSDEDRAWVEASVTISNHLPLGTPRRVREAFWNQWTAAKAIFPGLLMVAECLWPVEARFIMACIADEPTSRNWEGPYPFHEIASIMVAAGMDPMATYARLPEEMPAHDPSGDARQSARLLTEALNRLDRAAIEASLQIADKAILYDHATRTPQLDHSCARCVPDSDLLMDGHVCAYHQAVERNPELAIKLGIF